MRSSNLIAIPKKNIDREQENWLIGDMKVVLAIAGAKRSSLAKDFCSLLRHKRDQLDTCHKEKVKSVICTSEITR